MTPEKRLAALTIDFEDYRRQERRDHLGRDCPPSPAEIEGQLEVLLEVLESCDARATFFSVGRLARELSPGVWKAITARHQLGCHGYEHLRVRNLGPQGFQEDLHAAKAILEDRYGQPVISHRSPYFSSDGCDPWFGDILAREGFRYDSSRRFAALPPGFQGTLPLPGGDGAVQEVPLPSIGFGPKRITVIGGTYFRLLPLQTIVLLLERAERKGFIPMVYLHPYEFDAAASPLEYPHWGYAKARLGDWMRRQGRRTAPAKLRALSRVYDFQPLEAAALARSPVGG